MNKFAEMAMQRREIIRARLRIVLGIIYFVAGVAHILLPRPFIHITPDWVPAADLVVAATGVAEIAGAAALLFIPSLRIPAGMALALYAICVFPANIKHAFEGIEFGGSLQGWAYHGPRLAFQPVIVWWALFVGGIVDWPWRKPQDSS